MKNIKEFNSQEDFLSYVYPLIKKQINSGSEGDIYLTKDKEILKVMSNFFSDKYLSQYPNIIMSSDLKLDSFIFPDELYVSNDLILGYREKYFENDLFNVFPKEQINIENLIKAREKFIEDTKIITDYGYRLFELPRNIMFDNKRLVAIDTLDYIKEKTTLKDNIEIIDYALLTELSDIYNEIDNENPFTEEIQKVYKK
ncbi:MAG: hypothetical protein IJ715_02990 [Bacilli bacterium]|nr:hypothetical protein [Bacilli bacterium]